LVQWATPVQEGLAVPDIEPLALSPRDAAAHPSLSKRSLSRLIAARKIIARKDGPRTLVDMASIRAYYESLPINSSAAGVLAEKQTAPDYFRGRCRLGQSRHS
jgi:hypothetical protein